MGFIQKIKDRYAYKKEVAMWHPLSEKLRQVYVEAGLCETWTSNWGEPTRKELLSKYTSFAGVKFSIEHNIPSVDFIDKNLKGHCEDMGIYVNDDNVKSHNQETVVLNGNCNGVISVDNNRIAIHYIHVRNNTIINVEALNGSYSWIKVYGNQAHIKLNVKDGAKVVVFYMNEKGTATIFKKNITESNSPYIL